MSSSEQLSRCLKLAITAARKAGSIVMQYFQTAVAVETKSDSSPVTEADRNAEKELRGLIWTKFPDDAILGEEFGDTPGTSGRRWILDPIDGTWSFVRGVPLFGVLIGMEQDGEPVLGVVHIPALGEMVYAAKGLGAWWIQAGRRRGAEPTPARVSPVTTLSDCLISFTSATGFDSIGSPGALERLRKAAKLDRGWGDCYGHVLVATGRAEVMLDPLMNIWDCAALMPIVQEAGGRFTDFKGAATIAGGSAISTNGLVHDEVLKLLR
ncbi:MAG: histidinol-phosphatase [Candidatus Riflebacteria bacterium]|nr:histidinol-phosphatase [Candidatus Riflebacteria bacterium]